MSDDEYVDDSLEKFDGMSEEEQQAFLAGVEAQKEVAPEVLAGRREAEVLVRQAVIEWEQKARRLLGDAMLNARAASMATAVVPIDPEYPVTVEQKVFAAALIVNPPIEEGAREGALYLSDLKAVSMFERKDKEN